MKIRDKIKAEQSTAYETTSSVRIEIEVAMAALRWISNTPVIKTIIVSDS